MTTQNGQNQSNQENQGLPEIANSNPAKVRVYAVFGCALMLLIGWFLFSKSEKKEKKPSQDETFAVESLAPDMGAKKEVKNPSHHQIQSAPAAIQLKTELPDQQAQLIEKQKELKMRLEAPLMIVANSSGDTVESSSSSKKTASNPNTQFLNEVSNQENVTVQATVLHNLSTLVTEGHLIYATMESAVNTDLPGHLRALVSFPVYSEDGSQVLIPAGSRLIGQYKSGILHS